MSRSEGVESLRDSRHKKLLADLKLLPIFRCGYCDLPHPTRYCPNFEDVAGV